MKGHLHRAACEDSSRHWHRGQLDQLSLPANTQACRAQLALEAPPRTASILHVDSTCEVLSDP